MNGNLYESASPAMLAEIAREAESLLDDQLAAAIAADQRALTFAGLLVAAIGAMIGAVASLGGRASIPTLLFATVLAVAAGLALWSARPTGWKYRGNAPRFWQPDIIGERDLHASMAEMVVHYEIAERENHRAMDQAAWAMRGSMALTAAALVGALGWSWWALLSA